MRFICLVILLLLCTLQGCGRKGGLYLPTHQPNLPIVSEQSEPGDMQ